MQKRAVLYARVSSDDTGKDGRNLAGQLEMCRKYAVSRGWKIVAELAEDERGASGAKMDLPQLNRALDMAANNEFDVLVVRELDRLARSLEKQVVVEASLKRDNVEIEYVIGDYDDTPFGTMSKHFLAVMAEFEREQIRARMMRGKRARVKAGNVSTNRPPYGYRIHFEGNKASLVIEESEAKVIRDIFQWYTVGGDSHGPLAVGRISTRLSQLGYPTYEDIHSIGGHKQRAVGKWGRSSVHSILVNETYAGTWAYGKNRRIDGKLVANPSEEIIQVEVPAIISRQTWQQAQSRLQHNRIHSKRNRVHEYLMAGLLKCPECGCRMQVSTKSANSKTYRYYRCIAYSQYAIDCSTRKYFNADLVDAHAWKWVAAILTEPETLESGLEAFQAELASSTDTLQEQSKKSSKELGEIEKKADKLLQLYLDGKVDEKTYDRHRQALMQRADLLRAEADRAQRLLAQRQLSAAEANATRQFASTIAKGLRTAETDFGARRQIIESLHVSGRLHYKKGEQILDLECAFGDMSLSTESNTTHKAHRTIFLTDASASTIMPLHLCHCHRQRPGSDFAPEPTHLNPPALHSL